MADASFQQARKRSPLFVLMADDGRFATYDTGTVNGGRFPHKSGVHRRHGTA